VVHTVHHSTNPTCRATLLHLSWAGGRLGHLPTAIGLGGYNLGRRPSRAANGHWPRTVQSGQEAVYWPAAYGHWPRWVQSGQEDVLVSCLRPLASLGTIWGGGRLGQLHTAIGLGGYKLGRRPSWPAAYGHWPRWVQSGQEAVLASCLRPLASVGTIWEAGRIGQLPTAIGLGGYNLGRRPYWPAAYGHWPRWVQSGKQAILVNCLRPLASVGTIWAGGPENDVHTRAAGLRLILSSKDIGAFQI
jgi:hypothetical protein